MVEDPVSPIDPRTGDLARFASALAGAAGAWAVEEMVAHALDGAAAGARAALYRELIRRNRRRALSAPAEREDNMPVRRAEDFARRIEQLPLEDKEALLLVALVRFSYAEAAETLEISAESFIERIARARARLDCGQPLAPPSRPGYLRIVK